MNLKNKNGLKEVTLLRSGEFGFAQINTDGNILINGHNGAGKTTLQRAILFFYHPSTRRSDFGISMSKKSFEEYFFPHEDAYLLYHYKNDNGDILAVVHRSATRKDVRVKLFVYEDYSSLDIQKIFLNGGRSNPQDIIFSSLRFFMR